MSSRQLRLGWALGVSAVLHLAVFVLLQAPEPPYRDGSAMNVLIVPLQPAGAPAAPPLSNEPARPERRAERAMRPQRVLPVAPAQVEPAPRGPSRSVAAGPISNPRSAAAPASNLTDAATYVDAEELRDWPKLLGRFSAAYPPQAYEQRRKGVVVVQLMIDETGKVSEALALPGADTDLVEASLRAFRDARFRPAVESDGRPARARVFYSVSFVIE